MKIAQEINCNCIIVIEITLREKCLYLKFFWSLFFRIRIEFGNLQSSFPYSAQNARKHNQENSKYGDFSRGINLTAYFPTNAKMLT